MLHFILLPKHVKTMLKRLIPKVATKALANAKERSVVPIKSTIETIKNYPSKLVIFKVPASKFYWVRYYDGKPIKRSTKTESRAEAIRFAKNFYETLLVNKRLGIGNNSKQTSFVICANEVINADENKVKRGELAATYVNSQINIINKHIMTFFKNYEIGDIDYKLLDKFKTYLYEKELAAGTIKINFVCLKKIFDYAQRNNIIGASPLLPKVKTVDNARGYFTLDEYKHLRRTTANLVGTVSEVMQTVGEGENAVKKKLRNIVITEEVKQLIPFMLYTFIRPTDIKNIKHKHIDIRSGDEGEYLFMPIPPSKKHSKPITSMPRATVFYKQLRDARIKRVKQNSSDKRVNVDISDDYLFMPDYENRSYAYAKIARQFDVLLAQSELKNSVDGDVRTLYSMRHTSLMYRLKYGAEINPLKLANNARTSVEMLERFYLAQLESSEYTKDLHAKKIVRKRDSKKEGKIAVSKPVHPSLMQVADKAAKEIKKLGSKKGITFSADGEGFVIK